MNKLKNLSIDKKIRESKFNINKNFIYFLIAPLVFIIVGIILLCTVGFNLGTDFTGASVFKIYINNEASFNDENIKSYDLENKDDYNEIYDKIDIILEENGLKIDSYRTTTMNIPKYHIYGGQAIEVSYQNLSDVENEINVLNSSVRNDLISAFNYINYDDAVSSVDYIPAQSSFGWAIAIVASIVFAFILLACYMAFRFNVSVFIVGIMQVALDLFLTICLVLICRVPVNLTFGITLFATFVMTIFNLFYFYNKIKDNLKSGRFEKAANAEIANSTVKEITVKKSIIYIALILTAILFSALAVNGVREVALGFLLSLIATYYTSEFVLPSLWATMYRKGKAKKKTATVKNEQEKISN